MKNVYLECPVSHWRLEAFKFHCKKTVTLVFPRCGEVFVVTEAERFGARVK
jgi:hypothetical protein